MVVIVSVKHTPFQDMIQLSCFDRPWQAWTASLEPMAVLFDESRRMLLLSRAQDAADNRR